eukprot:COSAG01_NODE_14450_length_1452_cov_2.142646_2_plen_257_part_00
MEHRIRMKKQVSVHDLRSHSISTFNRYDRRMFVDIRHKLYPSKNFFVLIRAVGGSIHSMPARAVRPPSPPSPAGRWLALLAGATVRAALLARLSTAAICRWLAGCCCSGRAAAAASRRAVRLLTADPLGGPSGLLVAAAPDCEEAASLLCDGGARPWCLLGGRREGCAPCSAHFRGWCAAPTQLPLRSCGRRRARRTPHGRQGRSRPVPGTVPWPSSLPLCPRSSRVLAVSPRLRPCLRPPAAACLPSSPAMMMCM